MTTQLVRYEQARTALAEAHRVDEVKDIHDKAEAMAAYARQAKDQDLILWATEIKVRAERKAGEMLAEAARRGERATQASGGSRGAEKRWNGSSPRTTSHAPTLAEIGITRDQSSRWQQLASMSSAHFEAAVATAKDTAGQVTTAFMLREANKAKPNRKLTKRDQERMEELKAAQKRGVSMLQTYARLLLTALHAQDDFTDDEFALLEEVAKAIQKVSVS